MFTWTLIDNDTGQMQVIRAREGGLKGWEELVIKHERDAKWHGINYDFTSELGFFCKGGGKELVDNAYESKGQEGDVSLTLDVKHNGQSTRLFTGKLNFSGYRQEWISGVLYSFLDVENEDIKKLLNVREGIEVNLLRSDSLGGVAIPSYPYSQYEISMHSKVIKLVSSWENTLSTVGCTRVIAGGIFEARISEWLKVQGELKESNEIPPSIEAISGSIGTLIKPIIEVADSYEFPFDITINWDVAGTYFDKSFLADGDLNICGSGTPTGVSRDTNGFDVTLSLFKGSNPNDIVNNTTRWDLVRIPAYNELDPIHSANFTSGGQRSITTTINRGEKLWLLWLISYQATVGSNVFDIQWSFIYERATISAVAETTTPASQCTGIAIHEAWSKLSSILTDQPLAFYSEFFGRTDSNITYQADGCGSKTAVTSGLNIRGFSDSEITTSLKKMFDACNSIWAIGLGIEDYQGVKVLRVEPVYYFYQNVEVLRLDNVPNIKMTHLQDKVYNKVVVGFQKWNTEATNGLDEPLTRIEYAIPRVRSNANSLELICPFVGGMYAIEQTRRKNHLDFSTEDTGYDENTFFICLNKDDLTIPEKNENFSMVTGLLSPETAYNLRFFLSSTLDRIKYLFTSGLTKLTDPLPVPIMPTKREGNFNVSYKFVPDGCDGDHFGTQKGNATLNLYPSTSSRRQDPLWLPEEYTFEYPLTFQQYLTLIQNPYGYVSFSDGNDNWYHGFIESLEYNVRQKSASFQLIRKY